MSGISVICYWNLVTFGLVFLVYLSISFSSKTSYKRIVTELWKWYLLLISVQNVPVPLEVQMLLRNICFQKLLHLYVLTLARITYRLSTWQAMCQHFRVAYILANNCYILQFCWLLGIANDAFMVFDIFAHI
jgi:hypothetical protein